MKILIVVVAFAILVFVTGCSLFGKEGGLGGDDSSLNVQRDKQCRVNIGQTALSEGADDSKVVEHVKISADCEVDISFRQNVGDDAEKAMDADPYEKHGDPLPVEGPPVAE